jgi:hypothetical protein
MRKCLFLSLIALGLSAGPAAADDPLPAVAQYVESIPTGSGPVRGQASDPDAPKAELSAPVESSLQQSGGTDENTLREIATEPSLGAPKKRFSHPPRSDEAQVAKEASGARSLPTGHALSTAVTGGSGQRLPAILLGLIVLTPAVLVGGRRRARHDSAR